MQARAAAADGIYPVKSPEGTRALGSQFGACAATWQPARRAEFGILGCCMGREIQTRDPTKREKSAAIPREPW